MHQLEVVEVIEEGAMETAELVEEVEAIKSEVGEVTQSFEMMRSSIVITPHMVGGTAWLMLSELRQGNCMNRGVMVEVLKYCIE